MVYLFNDIDLLKSSLFFMDKDDILMFYNETNKSLSDFDSLNSCVFKFYLVSNNETLLSRDKIINMKEASSIILDCLNKNIKIISYLR